MRPPRPAPAPVLVCDGLAADDVGPVSFTVNRGEIVGLVGLRGAGHEIIGRLLVGDVPKEAGRVTINGAPLNSSSPTTAIADGVGIIAADRIAESIAPGLSIRENMFLNPRASGSRLLSWRKPRAEVQESRQAGSRVGLVPNIPDEHIESLSGGNQQKVVLSRWIRIAPKVLVLEDPTAGVDVGAKSEIYHLLSEQLAAGQAVLLISTDFEEVAEICHRALVFRHGQIVSELDSADLSIESVTLASSSSDVPIHAGQTAHQRTN